jgi:hypothetical protein
MGVDLTLLPVEEETADGSLICNLWFYLDLSLIIAPFVSMQRTAVSGNVFWPIERVPQFVIETLPQDAPLMTFLGEFVMFAIATKPDLEFVYAEDVRRAFENNVVDMDEVNDFERAAIAYISNLDGRKKIVLYWC